MKDNKVNQRKGHYVQETVVDENYCVVSVRFIWVED